MRDFLRFVSATVAVFTVVLFPAAMSGSAAAATLPSLPVNLAGRPVLGTGTVSTVSGTGSFVDIALSATTDDLFAIELTVTAVDGGNPNAPGLGELQLYGGATLLAISNIAASEASWFNESAGNTWYGAAAVPQGYYGVGNLVDGSAGAVNNNYTTILGKNPPAVQVGDSFVIYAALATPQTVTKASLGTGTNRAFTYDVKVYGLGGGAIAVPEPRCADLAATLLFVLLLGCARPRASR